jgi:hypothetical protein
MLKLMMLELLNIELFLSLKVQHKINTKSLKKIRASSHYCWKALDEWDIFGDDFVILKPNVWSY